MAEMKGSPGGAFRRRGVALAIGGVLAVVAGVAVLREQRRAATAAAAVADLHSIEELRVPFNADAGVPRLVLLLSPT